ncbi:sigma 54-interacting transcriptional regulator, partial [bacterium]|nr:sigma 54-interacting transcriptional regulator [bacterium]
KFTPEDLKKLCAITRISSQSINRELKTQNLNRKIESLESERKHWFSSILTKGEPPIPTLNKKYQQLLFVAMRIGKANQHVLLIGEQGTGKTLIAQRIHAFSERKKLPFITLDCMRSPKKILADILFGSNEQNAMIVGLLAQAHESTLFIRELSALPLELQNRLAQKLNKHLFAPEDNSQKTAKPVRLIATSDINPTNSTSEHIFHPDLLALIQATVKIPSLSDRPEDILPLAKYFLRTYLPSNRAVMDFAPETAELMIRYSWPNNVTELEDCMRYTAAVCIEQKIHIGDLPQRLRDQPAPAIPDNLNLRDQMGQLETNLIRIALDRNKQIVTRAANDLGLSESTLRYRMQRLKIKI